MNRLTAGIRVRRGDYLTMRTISNVSDVVLTPRFRVVYDSGRDDTLSMNPLVLVGDRALTTTDGTQRAIADGWIVGGAVNTGTINSFPGQVYVDVGLTDGSTRTCLCKGYSYDGRILALGESQLPGEGPGDLQWETVVFDAIGTASSAIAAGFANQIRKIRAVVVYYNASADVATRTIALSVALPGGAVPTGFAGTGIVWTGPTLTLTASEEGTYYIFSGPSGALVATNDNGTLAYANTSTAPAPFPLVCASDGDASTQILFTIGAGHANDRWSAYVLREDWVTQL